MKPTPRSEDNPASRDVPAPRKVLEAKHPLAIRWFHWINFPILFIMIWSGLLIYWANDVYIRISWDPANLTPEQATQKIFESFHLDARLAEGMAWHFTFMWIFAVNGLLYVTYTAFSGEWKYLLPGKKTLREAIQVVLHDLKIRREPLPRAKFNGAQRIAYTGVVLMGLGSLLSGLAIYKPVQAAILSSPFNGFAGATGYEVARFIHFWLTIGFCLFFLTHVLQVARAGWNNFRAMITGYEIVEEDGPDLAASVKPSSKPPADDEPIKDEPKPTPGSSDATAHPAGA